MPPEPSPAPGTPLPAPLDQLAAPPVFVVGLFRSGTTWIYDVLSAHPEAAGIFESWLFTRAQGIANLFHPGHWPEDLDGQHELFGAPFKMHQLIDRERFVSDVRELVGSWMREALEPQHRYLVEKTPAHHETMPIIAELWPGARFVHVIRDGRDTAVSTTAAARSWGGGRFRNEVSAGETAARWQAAVRLTRRHAEDHGLDYIEVRYEDMKRDPVAQTARLYDFAGMPHDEALLREVTAATDFGAVSRGQDDRFRRKGQVGEWRSSLGLLDRLRFERGSQGLLVELGYEDSSRWWLRRPGRP